MHKLIAIAPLFMLILPLTADDVQSVKPEEKQIDKKDKPLGVGDRAPALHVAKWLQGAEIKEFAPGKIYVVDFWSTWCGPCITAMPHLSVLQDEYRAKGVVFIGLTTKDEKGNTSEKAIAFVEKRGPKLNYTFAYADDRGTYRTWISEAKRTIPCSFVIGNDGKIVFIGHPMYLDEVLPKVVAGTWNDSDVEAMAKLEIEVNEVYRAIGGSDAEDGLKALLEFQKKHPKLAGMPYFVGPRIGLLIKNKKSAEARKTAEDAIAQAIANDDTITLSTLAALLRSPDASKDRELVTLSLKAAEAWMKMVGDKDMFALWNIAEAYFALGEVVKAREYGVKAMAAGTAESEAVKKYIQQQIKRFDMVKTEK
jgi:thiol-disulfide isomerase/thioredoxin